MDSSLQTLIANVGFPIAISMYLLIRIEGKLTCLTDSINELSQNISSKAQESSDQVVESISVKLVDISNDISSAIDNEINQTEQQVNGIIEEMKKGQANIDARKKIIAACETKIRSINTNLDAFTFELLEQN